MRLSEIFAGTSPIGYIEAALLLFMAAFALVTIWALTRPRDQTHQHARLPLEDSPEAANGPSNSTGDSR